MKKSVFWTGALKASQALSGLIVALVLTRYLGVENFGIYSFVVAVASLLSVPVVYGISELVVRETARARVHQDWAILNALLRWSCFSATIFSIFVAALVFFSIWLLDSDAAMVQASKYAAGIIFVLCASSVWTALSRGLGQPILSMLPAGLLRPIVLMFLIVVVSAYTSTQTIQASDALIMHTFAFAIVGGISATLLARHFPKGAWLAKPAANQYRIWFRLAVSFGLLGGLEVANRQIDLVFIGVMLTEKDAGIFRIASMGAILITFATQALNVVLGPKFAQYQSRTDSDKLIRLIRISSLLSLLCSVVGFVSFFFAGQWILRTIFGIEYLASYTPLMILSLGYSMVAANGSIIPLLNMTGNQSSTLRVFQISIVTNLILNFILIKNFGINGAAFATLLATLLCSHMLRKASIRELGIDPLRILFAKTR